MSPKLVVLIWLPDWRLHTFLKVFFFFLLPIMMKAHSKQKRDWDSENLWMTCLINLCDKHMVHGSWGEFHSFATSYQGSIIFVQRNHFVFAFRCPLTLLFLSFSNHGYFCVSLLSRRHLSHHKQNLVHTHQRVIKRSIYLKDKLLHPPYFELNSSFNLPINF